LEDRGEAGERWDNGAVPRASGGAGNHDREALEVIHAETRPTNGRDRQIHNRAWEMRAAIQAGISATIAALP